MVQTVNKCLVRATTLTLAIMALKIKRDLFGAVSGTDQNALQRNCPLVSADKKNAPT